MYPDIIKEALDTIRNQAEAISGLSAFIDNEFVKAVLAIHGAKPAGRVVVSGVGKSALIGQKIAATMNSTGTPALFMHAAEAIHGDLGMIQEKDVILLLSKSGESPEIRTVVPLIRAFGNTLIALTGSPDSYLARESSIVLNCHIDKEACSYNLAPTTSTTAQLVMGDALALCLMKHSGFSGKDFARYHPGGNLGKRLYLRVSDCYNPRERPSVSPDAPLKDVILVMSRSRLGATAVVDASGGLKGVITDGDLRRMLEKTEPAAFGSVKASALLSTQPRTISEDRLAADALDLLREYDISQLLVLDDRGDYCGVLHIHDLMREGIV